MKHKRRKKKNKTIIAAFVLMQSILVLIIVLFFGLLYTRVEKKFTVYAGQELTPEMLKSYSWDQGVVNWVEEPDTKVVGTQICKVYALPVTYTVTLYVMPPEEGMQGSVQEVTLPPAITVTPEPTPSPVPTGIPTSANTPTPIPTPTITPTPTPEIIDRKAPVVTVTDIDVEAGGRISYKKAVSYYDDIDSMDEMKLEVQRDSVNPDVVGTYEVTYTVTDRAGNSTSVVGKVNVLQETPKWNDEDRIHEKAKEILASVLEDSMTDREKAKAIYKWTKSHIGFIDHSEKGNYIRGAYEGLFEGEGDCFVYAATAKELLTQAGIPNIDIVKSTTNPSHYWNLVYIEDGWYHFDTTPRKDKSEFFLLTDAELDAYSKAHRNTHIFDRSLYPEIK